MTTFLLFRQKCLEALWCAVPESFFMPGFLTPRNWEFKGIVEETSPPVGFTMMKAVELSRMNGFYLFHSQ